MSRVKELAGLVRAGFRLMRNPEVQEFNGRLWRFVRGGDVLSEAQAAEALAGTAIDEAVADSPAIVKRGARCVRSRLVKMTQREIERLD